MTTAGAAPTEDDSGSLFVRMVALLVLAGGVNLWTTQHFGVGLEDPKLLGGLGALLAGGASLLDRIADKQAKESFWRRIQHWLQPLLAWPLLVVLYLIAAVLFVSYSSIAIIPSSGGERLSADIVAVDDPAYTIEDQAPAAGSVLLIPVQIRGFGRAFRVEVEGYLTASVEVAPLTGKRVWAGEDLQPLPSLLLRPPPDALRSLAGGGSLWISRVTEGGSVPLVEGAVVDAASGSAPKGASFLVGRPQAVPTALESIWRLELDALGLESAQVADALLQWRQPQVVVPGESLEPGMVLEVEIRSRVDKVKARAVIIVGTERLKDIPLSEVWDDTP